MTEYIDQVWLATETCCNCGMTFAMPSDYQQRRVKDKKTFYCPSGHRQHYIGKSEEQKLKDRLARERLQTERAEREARELADALHVERKAKQRIQTRIKNGVCPCCDRHFTNLYEHMKTKHGDYAKPAILKTLRSDLELTQFDLESVLGIPMGYISLYENEKATPEYAKEIIDTWIEENF